MPKQSGPVPIRIGDELGRLLMFRRTVAPLFRKISRIGNRHVIVDFSEVEFMSRSFADEYLAAKRASAKTIEERHVPLEVRRMLRLVTRHHEGAGPKAAVALGVPPEAQLVSP